MSEHEEPVPQRKPLLPRLTMGQATALLIATHLSIGFGSFILGAADTSLKPPADIDGRFERHSVAESNSYVLVDKTTKCEYIATPRGFTYLRGTCRFTSDQAAEREP